MAISFGGLATGLDTAALIEGLMEVERQPLIRYETDKIFFNNRLSAYTEFNTTLTSLLSSTNNLDTATDLQTRKASLSSGDFVAATVNDTAALGSYQIKAMTLAQVQKDVTVSGYSSKTDTIFHDSTITIDDGSGNLTALTIGADVSLETIRDQINTETDTTGVTATIINDGTTNGYRMVLTGKDSATNFSAIVSGGTVDAPNTALDFGHTVALSTNKHTADTYANTVDTNFTSGTITITDTADDSVVGTYTITNDNLDTIKTELNAIAGIDAVITGDATNGYKIEINSTDPLSLKEFTISVTDPVTAGGFADLEFTDPNTHTQDAQQAEIIADGITIYSDTNTFSEAIAGVTMTLAAADGGATVNTLTVGHDVDALKSKVSAFVASYNSAVSFITNQSTYGDSETGILGSDASLRQIKGRLQKMLTTQITSSSNINTLSELGLETQRDGTLKIDDTALTAAITDDLDGVVTLLAGSGSGDTAVVGIASQLTDYLGAITSKTDGFLTAKKASTTSTTRRLDNDILRLEQRLEKREEMYLKQFTALEQLISAFNSQSDFLTQQIDMLSSLWSRD